MSLKCGIVGLPNVGKSTLFSALTHREVPAENYPFCTIDPHKAMVPVPDPRLNRIADWIHPQKVIPNYMEFVDIAGLVKGAHLGEGLGNQFLSHIRESHALIHVLRCFEDDQIVHVEGHVNPIRDMETINTELILSDLQSLENFLQKKKKTFKNHQNHIQQKQKEEKLLTQLQEHLSQSLPARSFFAPLLKETDSSSKKDTGLEELLKEMPSLLTAKPVLYLCNLKEPPLHSQLPSKTEEFKALQQVKERAQKENHQILSLCGTLEAEISQLPKEEQEEFLKDLGLKEPSLNRLIRAAYQLLGLQTFFTAGPKEVRAWTMKSGTKAPQAAGLIHSDFEKGFIRAEVYRAEDLFRYHDEKKIRAAGLYRSEGKDYEIQDGDVVLFRFNV